LFLGYKPVQHVTVLNTVGNCNTVVLLYYYNLMGPPSYIGLSDALVSHRVPTTGVFHKSLTWTQ